MGTARGERRDVRPTKNQTERIPPVYLRSPPLSPPFLRHSSLPVSANLLLPVNVTRSARARAVVYRFWRNFDKFVLLPHPNSFCPTLFEAAVEIPSRRTRNCDGSYSARRLWLMIINRIHRDSRYKNILHFIFIKSSRKKISSSKARERKREEDRTKLSQRSCLQWLEKNRDVSQDVPFRTRSYETRNNTRETADISVAALFV